MPIDLNRQPNELPPPVHAVAAGIGLGKTRAWREVIAATLVGKGQHPVLAVPRHRLGDEIVRDFVALGFSACVYRGREAEDPDAEGMDMCRDLKRVGLVNDALGSVSPRACKHGDKQCKFYDICGYQRQRRQRPELWIVPHQLLFLPRPSFIPQPDALAIDELFSDAALNGLENPIKVWLRALVEEDRYVRRSIFGTADLVDISRRVHSALQRKGAGRIRRAALIDAYITAADLRAARKLEWRRKINITEVYPGMPIDQLFQICGAAAIHNQQVKPLAKFWEPLIATVEASDERSPWLELRTDEPLMTGNGVEPAVRMAWRDDIHPSWQAPTTVMDATMPVEIVRQFFPEMEEPFRVSAPMPHARVRQITDRAMTGAMLIPSPVASDRTNTTRRNNVERVRYFIEARAIEVCPGRVLVVCQLGLERELRQGTVPPNVDIQHFNAIAGENAWSDVALVIVIGRTEPTPRDVEAIARALFGAEIAEVEQEENGELRYPLVHRGIRMRDGSGFDVMGYMHPDMRAEVVRQCICEAGLVQAIGRGRGVNRTGANPLQIDIVTNVVLPIEVDEVTTWERIQSTNAPIMRARAAVPANYADMATAYPDLFVSGEAARKGLGRENPGQTPIEEYLIGVCLEFLPFRYRRTGTRGPAPTLLYDPGRIDPLPWLTSRLGDVAEVS